MTTEEGGEFPGDWAAPNAVPPSTPAAPSRPTTRQRIAPSIGLTVVALLVLLLLDREVAAAVAFVAALVVGVASFTSDAFVHAFARLQHRVAHAVGVGLTWVLLLPVHYLVFTPAGLIARLLRIDTLRPASGTLGWQQRTHDHHERPRRGFTDERSTLGLENRRDRRARTIRVVVAVVVIELAIFGVFRLIDERGTPQQEFAGVSGPGTAQSAALRDQPDLQQTMAELGQAARHTTYTPVGDQSVRDLEGQFVNVVNRVRRSHETTAPGEPLDVWFFGGSTMFGFDAQRDEHTIPSEVVRLAEAEGRPIRAHNYGVPGMTNYQETQVFAQLLVSGERADLAVFYDGTNDTALQLQTNLTHRDVPGEPGQLQSDLIRAAMHNSPLLGGPDEPPSPLIPGHEQVPAGQVPLDGLVADVVDVYADGVELSINLGNAYAIPVVHFWQPDLLTRNPLDPGEEPVVAAQGMDEFTYQSMRAFWTRVRAALPEGVVDIAGAFDELDGPVLSDIVHVNEDGARAVAAAMYPTLVAVLPSSGTTGPTGTTDATAPATP